MKALLFTLASLTLSAQAHAAIEVYCQGESSTGSKIQATIQRLNTGALAASIAEIEAGTYQVIYAGEVTYTGGRHIYRYLGPGMKLVMNDLAGVTDSENLNSTLSEVLPEVVRLKCCATISLTYPLSECTR
jgi:hypothetical protein